MTVTELSETIRSKCKVGDLIWMPVRQQWAKILRIRTNGEFLVKPYVVTDRHGRPAVFHVFDSQGNDWCGEGYLREADDE